MGRYRRIWRHRLFTSRLTFFWMMRRFIYIRRLPPSNCFRARDWRKKRYASIPFSLAQMPAWWEGHLKCRRYTYRRHYLLSARCHQQRWRLRFWKYLWYMRRVMNIETMIMLFLHDATMGQAPKRKYAVSTRTKITRGCRYRLNRREMILLKEFYMILYFANKARGDCADIHIDLHLL